MDEKEEDKSEESFNKHILFYIKLNRTISGIRDEIKDTGDVKILKHLNERIEAIEQDQKRIRKMFPEVDKKTWEELD